MKYQIISLGLCILITCLPQALRAANDFVELCRFFQNGTQIRKPGTCDEYIKCVNGEGTLFFCESPNIFDASSQKCVNATPNDAYCGNRCVGLDGKWVSDPTDCVHFFYCDNGDALPGQCSEAEHFDEAKQMCVYSSQSQCVDVANICEILPSKTKFRDETDCSKYYECDSAGKHSSKTCATGKYFDVEKGACDTKTLVACDAHPKKNICIKSSKILTGFQPDGATCRGYFYCKDLGIVEDIDPDWNQCPEGYFFHEGRQACVVPTEVVCKHNRCEGRGNLLVTSSSNDCHNYIRCSNGLPVEESTCHHDMFFDEVLQACTDTIIYDECCDGQ